MRAQLAGDKNQPERLLTLDDLVTWLQLPKSTIYSWVHERRIPFYKVGPRLRFDRAAIRNWLDGRAYGVELGGDPSSQATRAPRREC